MSKAKYKPYPEYKDSGVEWLGEVPVGWEVKRLKYIAKVIPSNVDKKTKSDEKTILLCNYTDVYYNNVINRSLDFMIASATEEQIAKFVLEKGDTIITKDSEDPNDIAIPAFVNENFTDVICGYHLAMIKPIYRDTGKYLKYFFESGYAHTYFTTRANGLTRYGLGTYQISNVQFLQPPSIEQSQIAAFLDHETAKIDKLIEKQKRLVELLKEKRQAVISHAVTKGLNPDAPKKDSGVEWLGEVPEHWEIVKISHLSYLKSGDFISSEEINVENDFPVLGGNGLRGYSSNYNLDGNYILIGRQGALCGNINYGVDKFWATEHAIIVFPVANFNNFWLGETLRVMNLNQYSISAAQPGLSISNISCLKIPFPAITEQNDIAEFIRDKYDKIDNLIKKSEETISLLQERRTALISAAVTGKIDVRDWKPPASKRDESKMPVEEVCSI